MRTRLVSKASGTLEVGGTSSTTGGLSVGVGMDQGHADHKLRVGDLSSKLDHYARAEGAYRQAARRLEALNRATPTESAYRLELGRTLDNLGRVVHLDRRSPDAVKLHRRVALVLCEDAALAEELLARKKLAQDVAGRLSDTALLVRPGRVEAVVEELRRMGQTPQVVGR